MPAIRPNSYVHSFSYQSLCSVLCGFGKVGGGGDLPPAPHVFLLLVGCRWKIDEAFFVVNVLRALAESASSTASLASTFFIDERPHFGNWT